MNRNLANDIAIIGMSARLPGANNIGQYWDNLINGRSALRWFSAEEVQNGVMQHDYPGIAHSLKETREPGFVRAGYVMDNPDLFDADFFGYTPSEAELIDPQQRHFLEVCFSALEHAGYDAESYPGLIGVFGGQSFSRYFITNVWSNREIMYSPKDLLAGIGSEADYLTNRVAYKLNLRGPAVNVQTACSTSLTAIHLGCQSLLNGESDMVLAGSSLINLPDVYGYLYREGSMVSPDGVVRAFDADAKGTVFSASGVGSILLKRAEDALEDGDTIYGLIRGSAINNDGSHKVGYTAPAIDGQVSVIRQALEAADVDGDSISYIEAHGTGTPLGDPIEVSALAQAYGEHTDKTQFCALGSAKTNIGHLAAAAGVAATIKAVLSLYHGKIPPSLNFSKPNPRIDFENSPFFVNTELRDWKTEDDIPKRCGISSFGVGGSNAHIVMEEAPTQHSDEDDGSYKIFPLSARTPAALEKMVSNLSDFIGENDTLNLANAAYTLQVGRKNHKQRLAVIGKNREQVIAQLNDIKNSRLVAKGEFGKDKAKTLVFMFTGQGSQYLEMARDLYRHEAAFTAAMDECFAILQQHMAIDLAALLYPEAADVDAAKARLMATDMTQPALFVVEYAMAKLMEAYGLNAQYAIGHSIGEYAAAHLAGVMSLADALKLVVKRGSLMQALEPGVMVAVTAGEEKVQPMLDAMNGKGASKMSDVAIAAVNAPGSCVVSGSFAAIEQLLSEFDQLDISYRKLHTSHAFHSPMMEPVLAEFKTIFNQVSLYVPQKAFISNVTGDWITDEQATSPDYWAKHLRGTVRFSEGLQKLAADHPNIALVEMGPGTTLTTLARRILGKTAVVVNTLRTIKEDRDDQQQWLLAVAGLWTKGAAFSFKAFHGGQRQRIALPTYPFESKRFWVEPLKTSEGAEIPQFGKQPDLDKWFFTPGWSRSSKAFYQLEAQTGPWLVFCDSQQGQAVVERLQQQEQTVITVSPGDDFAWDEDGHYYLRPDVAEDYGQLLDALAEPPHRVIHLWGIDDEMSLPVSGDDISARYTSAMARGFHSLNAFAQAIGERGIDTPLDITVVTFNAQEVIGGELNNSLWSALLGPVKTLGIEYANITARCVDVDLSRQPKLDVEAVIAEAVNGAEQELVAIRGNYRWHRDWLSQPISPLAPDSATGWVKGGSYFITGGLGGLGYAMAEKLAHKYQAKLTLTGRSPLPAKAQWADILAADNDDKQSRQIKQVQALEALGGEVLVVAANVTEHAQMQQAVAQARTQFGGIDGVIHSAGIAGGGLIQLKSHEQAEAVLAPKILGALILQDIFAAQPPSLMVLNSSLFAVTGGMGQVDYIAANSFLDAFAHELSATTSTRAISINWDGWEEIGMAAGLFYGGQSSPDNVLPGEPCVVKHPLLQHQQIIDDNKQIYYGRVSDSHWILQEHQINGQPAMPGTAWIDLGHSLGSALLGDGTLAIDDVYFMSPLIVAAGQSAIARIVVEIDAQSQRLNLSMESGQDDQWLPHAAMSVALSTATPSSDFDFDQSLQACSNGVIEIADDERMGAGEFLSLGDHWQSLKTVYLGDKQALAWFELDDRLSDDLEQFALHPALLDMATGPSCGYVLSTAIDDIEEQLYLPLSYGQIRVYAPLSAKIFAYSCFDADKDPSHETLSLDYVLTDESGRVLVEIDGFLLKKVNADLKHSSADALIEGGDVMGTERGILPTEGIEAFERIISAQQTSQVVVSTSHLPSLLKELKKAAQAPSNEGGGHARPDLASDYVKPGNKAEEILAAIFAGVLGIDQVGIEDNFFELGMDSVLGIQIVSQARKYDIKLTPDQLFDKQTIVALSAVLPDTMLTPTEQHYALSDCQGYYLHLSKAEARDYHLLYRVSLADQPEAALLSEAKNILLNHNPYLRPQFIERDGQWLLRVDNSEDREQRFALQSITAGSSDIAQSMATLISPPAQTNPWITFVHIEQDQANYLALSVHPAVLDSVAAMQVLAQWQSCYQRLKLGQQHGLTDIDLTVSDNPGTQSFAAATARCGEVMIINDERNDKDALVSLVAEKFNMSADEVVTLAMWLTLPQGHAELACRMTIGESGADSDADSETRSSTYGLSYGHGERLCALTLTSDDSAPAAAVVALMSQAQVEQYKDLLREQLSVCHSNEVYRNDSDGQSFACVSGRWFYQRSGFDFGRSCVLSNQLFAAQRHLQLHYDAKVFSLPQINELAIRLMDNLAQLAQIAGQIDEKHYTPSDFSDADLSLGELDNLMDQL